MRSMSVKRKQCTSNLPPVPSLICGGGDGGDVGGGEEDGEEDGGEEEEDVDNNIIQYLP